MMRKMIMFGLAVLFVIFVYAQTAPPPEKTAVCCVSPDGMCRDTGVAFEEAHKSQPAQCPEGWHEANTISYCQYDAMCKQGCCTIDGKQQERTMTAYACLDLCVRAGLCECSTDALNPSACTSQGIDSYTWSKGAC